MPKVHRARAIIDSIPGLSVRDALHIAVMERAGTTRILSFDCGFDACSGIDRVH
jgi:predicted nucleic acid-binding protein